MFQHGPCPAWNTHPVRLEPAEKCGNGQAVANWLGVEYTRGWEPWSCRVMVLLYTMRKGEDLVVNRMDYSCE